MIIPHIIDQYAWNNLIGGLGIGPEEIAINKIRARNLEPKILDLFQNHSYKIKVLDLSKRIGKEKYSGCLNKVLTG